MSATPLDPHLLRVRTALYRAGTGLAVANLVLTAYNCWRLPDAYHPGFALAVILLITAELAWCTKQCVSHEPRLFPLQLFVVTAYLVLGLHPLLVSHEFHGYPPLLHVLGAGMSLTALGFGVQAATLGVPAFAAFVGVMRTPDLGIPAAVGEACLQALGGLVVVATVYLLEGSVREVGEAVDAEWAARAQATLAERRAIERLRWDGLIHDKVLGALLIAGRAPDGPIPLDARQLATDAATAISGDGEIVGADLVPIWREHARRLGLDTTIAVSGQVTEPDVYTAVVDAVREALTNVARHSGQTQATIQGSMSETHVTIVVSDDGRGFSEDARAPRVGLRTLRARLAAIGGQATVWSSPGLGTRVTLDWDAYVSQSVPRGAPLSRAEWSLRAFTPMMALGAGVVFLALVLGAHHWLTAPNPALAFAAVATIVGLTLAVSVLPARSPWMGVCAVVIAVLPAVVAADSVPDASPDWRYWQLSALTPAIGAVSFRYRRYLGLVTGTVAALGVGIVDAVQGHSFFSSFTGPLPVLVVTAVSGHLLRLTLNHCWDQVAAATKTTADWRLREAVEQERSREARRRTVALDRLAAPALRTVREEPTLTHRQRSELLVTEAAIRDQLTAPALVDSALEQLAHDARVRGVVVELLRTDLDELGQVPTVDEAEVIRTRQAVAPVLELAAPGSRVRLQWHPGRLPRSATVSYVGRDTAYVARAFTRAAQHAEPRWDAVVSDHGSALLLEF